MSRDNRERQEVSQQNNTLVAVAFAVGLGLAAFGLSLILAEHILFWWLGHVIVGGIAGYNMPVQTSRIGKVIIGIGVALASWFLADVVLSWWLPYATTGVAVFWITYQAIIEYQAQQS